MTVEQIKDELNRTYNHAIDLFYKADYKTFFGNIRPAIEWLSKLLIFEFMRDDRKANDLLDGKSNIDDKTNKYETNEKKPTSSELIKLFTRCYHYSYDNDSTREKQEKKNMGKKMDNFCLQLCHHYQTASLYVHSNNPKTNPEIQAKSCTALIDEFIDFICSYDLVSPDAKVYFAELNEEMKKIDDDDILENPKKIFQ